MTEADKNKVARRLRIIEGQVRGLQKMIENDTYCIDIITQSAAVKKALSSVEDVLLQNHLSTHVVEQIKCGEETRATEEVLKVYKLKENK